MKKKCILNIDLAKIVDAPKKGKFVRMVAWGDEVDVLNYDAIKNGTAENVVVEIFKFLETPDGFKPQPADGFILAKNFRPAEIVCPKENDNVLKFNFVDVQQGDGSVIETPAGKVILVDGGDNVMFARYLASRFRADTEEAPQPIDCVLVTHGDADHFMGLIEIARSEAATTKWKRLFIDPERVYHNGLVKRPSKDGDKKRKDTEMLGKTKSVKNDIGKDVLLVTELNDDLLKVDDKEMNTPFLKWKRALQTYDNRRAAAGKPRINFRRLEKGDKTAFKFLESEGIKVEVLGPIVTEIGGTKGLKFLGDPPKGPRIGHESMSIGEEGFSGHSASHTINGHSIVFRLSYGSFSFLFTGDLNDEAARALIREDKNNGINLRSEVFKVPHHGSADFSAALLKAVSPLISIISSGDESAQKEYIHPRATIVGALGKYSRSAEPLVFVTELVAFFELEGAIQPEFHKLKDGVCVVTDGVAELNQKARKSFFAFSRTKYGIVKVRTDGKRLLVYTNSGQSDLKEAYAYEARANDQFEPVRVRQA